MLNSITLEIFFPHLHAIISQEFGNSQKNEKVQVTELLKNSLQDLLDLSEQIILCMKILRSKITGEEVFRKVNFKPSCSKYKSETHSLQQSFV